VAPADEQRDGAEVRQMQAAFRTRILQAAGASVRGLRGLPPAALLGLFCAAALSPLGAVGAGLGAAAIAGSGVLSSVGGGVLSAIIASALDRAWSKDKDSPAAEFDKSIAEGIERVLATETVNAQVLRTEIAAVLERIDAGGTALRAAMEQADERVRGDILVAMEELSWSYDETRFLIRDVTRAAAGIQKSLDVQSADIRTIVDQNNRQSTDIRLVREGLAAIAGRSHRAEPGGGREDSEPSWDRGSPYRGLLPFEQTDAEVFYGRERLTAELAVRVAARVADGGLIVVTGASGSGKSSLLRAGLLPALARGQQVEGSDGWARIIMTPTKEPLAELASRLAALGAGDSIAIRDNLRLHPGQAHMTVWSALLADAARGEAAGQPRRLEGAVRLALVIDQFEQVFTLNPEPDAEADRRAFITALFAAAMSPAGPRHEPPALVVIAVRGDFWDRCAAYPELAQALGNGQFVVGPMTESELRRAIVGPADVAGLRIDPGLTDTILSDLRAAGNDAGVLPLLSQSMLLTWKRRDGDRLTVHGYGLTGGVSSAVQTSAEGVYGALSAARQALARDLLRRMTVLGRDGRLTRRPVTRSDLHGDHAEAERAGVDAVLEAFAQARLIVVDGDRVQIAHDALLQAWPRLRGWLEDDQASLIVLSQLADDAAAWRDNARDPSFLYRGTQLAAVRQAVTTWAAQSARFPALTASQEDFLQASDHLATRGARQRRAVIAVLVLLLAAALSGAGLASIAAANANSQRTEAVANQLAAESETLDTADPVTAAQLATAAWRIDRSDPKVTDSMLDVLAQPERGLLKGFQPGPFSTPQPVAFSPDGRLLAIRSGEKVSLFSLASDTAVGQPMGSGGTSQAVTAVAFSPDGTILATDDGGTVFLWSVATQAEIGTPLADQGHSISAFAFSPAGKTIATITSDGFIQLWNVSSHSRIGGSMRTGADEIFFSSNGKTFVTTDTLGGPVEVWNAATRTEIGSPLAVGSYGAIAVSPGGMLLAVGNVSGQVQLWNLNTRARIGAPLATGTGVVETIAFSPQSTTFAVYGLDSVITLWNAADRIQIGAALNTDSSLLADMAFNPAGTILAITAGDEADPTFWNVGIWHQDGPQVNIGNADMLAFSPDASKLAVVPQTISATPVSGNVQVWNLPAGTRAGTLPDIGQVMGVAFSGDGKVLATIAYPPGRDVTEIQLWDASDLVKAGTPWGSDQASGGVLLNHSGTIAFTTGTDQLWNTAAHGKIGGPMIPIPISAKSDVVFSPDGKIIAMTSATGSLSLWNTQTSKQIGSPLTASGADQVAFSADGREIATGNIFGTAQLWNVATRTPIGAPLNAGDVTSLAFGPDGKLLATATKSGTIQLWDTTTGAPIGAPLQMGNGPILGLAFSASGGTLEAASASTARSWEISFPANLPAAVCGIAGGPLTPRQWNLDAPSEAFQSTCPGS
jgi:WD40 repeat protein